MKITASAFALFFCLSLGSWVTAQETLLPASECDFDNQGVFCINSEGVHGFCTEDGPNSCEGENPAFPGECLGYPGCSGDYGACFEKGLGDACTISTFINGEETEGTGICETIEGLDGLNCNLKADDFGPVEEEQTCHVAPFAQPGRHPWVVLSGLVALGLVWRARHAHSQDI